MVKRFTKYLYAIYLYYFGGLQNHIKKLQTTPCISIIYFHDPSPDEFEKYIKWLLLKGFEFISQEKAIKFIEGKIELRKCHIWITLDDGWQSNMDLVPVLEKYNIPITIFITTQSIESGFFRGSLERKLKHLLPDEYKNNSAQLKEIANTVRSEIDEKLIDHAKETLSREALTKKELDVLAKNKLVTIGLHTHTHPNLTKCTPTEIKNEIELNRLKISEFINEGSDVFSLPYGKYNDEVINIIRSTRVNFILTTKNGIVNMANRNRSNLPRNGIAKASFYENCCRMLNYWHPLKNR